EPEVDAVKVKGAQGAEPEVDAVKVPGSGDPAGGPEAEPESEGSDAAPDEDRVRRRRPRAGAKGPRVSEPAKNKAVPGKPRYRGEEEPEEEAEEEAEEQ